MASICSTTILEEFLDLGVGLLMLGGIRRVIEAMQHIDRLPGKTPNPPQDAAQSERKCRRHPRG